MEKLSWPKWLLFWLSGNSADVNKDDRHELTPDMNLKNGEFQNTRTLLQLVKMSMSCNVYSPCHAKPLSGFFVTLSTGQRKVVLSWTLKVADMRIAANQKFPPALPLCLTKVFFALFVSISPTLSKFAAASARWKIRLPTDIKMRLPNKVIRKFHRARKLHRNPWTHSGAPWIKDIPVYSYWDPVGLGWPQLPAVSLPRGIRLQHTLANGEPRACKSCR